MSAIVSDIEIQAGNVLLQGSLAVPDAPQGLVIFSHGTGSSKWSPRNRYVAEKLNGKNIATLLIDLLSPEEDEVYKNRFDIRLLSGRLTAVTCRIHEMENLSELKCGYFGASTGAASALIAASELPEQIDAVVIRGGRTDLADMHLAKVKAPTLMIAGGLDPVVLELNRKSARMMHCVTKLVIVEGAGHLFEEPGKLETVSELAIDWFEMYLSEVPDFR